MPLYFFYTMVQKSKKRPKTQIKGGPALIRKQQIIPNTSDRHDHRRVLRLENWTDKVVLQICNEGIQSISNYKKKNSK